MKSSEKCESQWTIDESSYEKIEHVMMHAFMKAVKYYNNNIFIIDSSIIISQGPSLSTSSIHDFIIVDALKTVQLSHDEEKVVEQTRMPSISFLQLKRASYWVRLMKGEKVSPVDVFST